MKTKNIRLRFNELFKGRIIYLTEPGMAVVTAKVLGHFNSTIKPIGLHFSTSEMKPNWNAKFDNYEILPYSEELMKKLGAEDMKLEGDVPKWVVITTYYIPNKIVKLGIASRQGEIKCHEFQHHYFDPNECHMRAFTSRRSAERYSRLFAGHAPGSGQLESIFG